MDPSRAVSVAPSGIVPISTTQAGRSGYFEAGSASPEPTATPACDIPPSSKIRVEVPLPSLSPEERSQYRRVDDDMDEDLDDLDLADITGSVHTTEPKKPPKATIKEAMEKLKLRDRFAYSASSSVPASRKA